MRAASARRFCDFLVEHSLVLPVGAIVALAWANTFAAQYARLSGALRFIVNDVGMAFFFALATKEVVEATIPGGALHSWRRAALPAVAATGGMIGPATLYMALIHLWHQPLLADGWAIPCATDIAFSYLVAKAIFGNGHPAIPFLLLLAIVDDALGLVLLAAFYPVGDLHLVAGGGLMAAAVTVSAILRRRRIMSFWPYVAIGGAASWCALYVGGLHPALALVPIVPFLPHAPRDPGLFVAAPPGARDPLSELEHRWKYPVQIVVLLFGLVNAGVAVQDVGTVTWAVLWAILAGKPIGIVSSVGIAVAAGLYLPERVTWRDVIVVGFTAAIGFTVALFFATVAFPVGPLLNQAKMGALLSVSGSAAALLMAGLLRVGRFGRRARHP